MGVFFIRRSVFRYPGKYFTNVRSHKKIQNIQFKTRKQKKLLMAKKRINFPHVWQEHILLNRAGTNSMFTSSGTINWAAGTDNKKWSKKFVLLLIQHLAGQEYRITSCQAVRVNVHKFLNSRGWAVPISGQV